MLLGASCSSKLKNFRSKQLAIVQELLLWKARQLYSLPLFKYFSINKFSSLRDSSSLFFFYTLGFYRSSVIVPSIFYTSVTLRRVNKIIKRFSFSSCNIVEYEYIFWKFINNSLFSRVCSEKYINQIVTFFAIINSQMLHINSYFSDELNVTGYARKAWLSRSNKFIILKVGASHLYCQPIPYNLSLNLIRKRTIKLFSINVRVLKKFSGQILNMRKATHFNGSGILLKSENLKVSGRFFKSRK